MLTIKQDLIHNESGEVVGVRSGDEIFVRPKNHPHGLLLMADSASNHVAKMLVGYVPNFKKLVEQYATDGRFDKPEMPWQCIIQEGKYSPLKRLVPQDALGELRSIDERASFWFNDSYFGLSRKIKEQQFDDKIGEVVTRLSLVFDVPREIDIDRTRYLSERLHRKLF